MKRKRKIRRIKPEFLLIYIIGVYFFSFIFIRNSIILIGYKIQYLKEEYEKLNLENKFLSLKLINMTSFENIEKLALEKNLIFTTPENWCVLKIEEKDENKGYKENILEAREK